MCVTVCVTLCVWLCVCFVPFQEVPANKQGHITILNMMCVVIAMSHLLWVLARGNEEEYSPLLAASLGPRPLSQILSMQHWKARNGPVGTRHSGMKNLHETVVYIEVRRKLRMCWLIYRVQQCWYSINGSCVNWLSFLCVHRYRYWLVLPHCGPMVWIPWCES